VVDHRPRHLRTPRRQRLVEQGGKKGLLVNSTNICKSTNRATVKLTAQNGKVSDTEPVVTNSCAKKQHKAHGGHHR
jgi:hypothetical protein